MAKVIIDDKDHDIIHIKDCRADYIYAFMSGYHVFILYHKPGLWNFTAMDRDGHRQKFFTSSRRDTIQEANDKGYEVNCFTSAMEFEEWLGPTPLVYKGE